jgi:hypothetical protein
VAELHRFILYDTVNFRLRENLGKLQIFEKITAQRQLDEWHLHPYIEPLSFQPDRALRYFAKFIIKMARAGELWTSAKSACGFKKSPRIKLAIRNLRIRLGEMPSRSGGQLK